jgi:hypothetical protein
MSRFRIDFLVATAAMIATIATPSLAGSNNIVNVRQENISGQQGNRLSIDQSSADNSAVIGLTESQLDFTSTLSRDGALENDQLLTIFPAMPTSASPAALQIGADNNATVVISGDGSVARLQQGTDGNPSSNNVAAIEIVGVGSSGTVVQGGLGGNNATIQISADQAAGLIGQFGTNLTATLTVAPNATGRILQNGTGSEAALDVQSNSTVTYTQVGDNLQPIGQGTVQFFSTNPGNITITQTGF